MLPCCAECNALLDPNTTVTKATAGCQADTKCNDCDGSFTCGTEQCTPLKLPPDCGRYMVYSELTDECISPCGTKNDPCRPPTECIVVNASVSKDRFTCTACPSGFTRNDFGDCVDVNECLDMSKCAAGTVCENSPGGFKCSNPFDASGTEAPATGGIPPPTSLCATNTLGISCPSVSVIGGTSAKLQCTENANSASNILKFAWRQISGLTIDLAQAPTGSAAATLELPPIKDGGTYTFRLTVTDDCGATATGVATVTVSSSEPTPPTPTLAPLDVGQTRAPLRSATPSPTDANGPPVRVAPTGSLSLAAHQHGSVTALLPLGLSVVGLWLLRLQLA
jgi:hypothetical protein